MSIAVAVSMEGVRLSLSRARVMEIAERTLRAEGVRDAQVSITFLTRGRMSRMNARHLGHRGPTDVISFGFDRAPGTPLVGDIYIAPDVARENARLAGERVRTELARLVIHGVLHVLGHDHPVDGRREASPMWRRQESLLRRMHQAGAA